MHFNDKQLITAMNGFSILFVGLCTVGCVSVETALDAQNSDSARDANIVRDTSIETSAFDGGLVDAVTLDTNTSADAARLETSIDANVDRNAADAPTDMMVAFDRGVSRDSGIDIMQDDRLVARDLHMLVGTEYCVSSRIQRADGSYTSDVPILGEVLSGTSAMAQNQSDCPLGTIKLVANSVGVVRVRVTYAQGTQRLSIVFGVNVDDAVVPPLEWYWTENGSNVVGQVVHLGFATSGDYSGRVPVRAVQDLASTNPDVMRIEGVEADRVSVIGLRAGQACLSGYVVLSGRRIDTSCRDRTFQAVGEFLSLDFSPEDGRLDSTTHCYDIPVSATFGDANDSTQRVRIVPQTNELSIQLDWPGAIAQVTEAPYPGFRVCFAPTTYFTEGSVNICYQNHCRTATGSAERYDAVEQFRYEGDLVQTIAVAPYAQCFSVPFRIWGRYRDGVERNITARTSGVSSGTLGTASSNGSSGNALRLCLFHSDNASGMVGWTPFFSNVRMPFSLNLTIARRR